MQQYYGNKSCGIAAYTRALDELPESQILETVLHNYTFCTNFLLLVHNHAIESAENSPSCPPAVQHVHPLHVLQCSAVLLTTLLLKGATDHLTGLLNELNRPHFIAPKPSHAHRLLVLPLNGHSLAMGRQEGIGHTMTYSIITDMMQYTYTCMYMCRHQPGHNTTSKALMTYW